MDKSMTATLKYALVSDIKMELIAKLVRGKSVEDALKILAHMPKKAAAILHKVIVSAAANAHAQGKGDHKTLLVQRIDVGAGPKIKRIRFSSRSRVSHYIRYRSFVRVVLHSK